VQQAHAAAGHAGAQSAENGNAMNPPPATPRAAVRRKYFSADGAVRSAKTARTEEPVGPRARPGRSRPFGSSRGTSPAIHGMARREKSPIQPGRCGPEVKSNLQGSGLPGKENAR